MRHVLMFSGQGAQYYQMGAELYRADPVYRDALAECEALVGPIDGRSLTEIMFGRPLADSADFDRLRETHPVLLAQGYAAYRALAARGVRPELLIGYSLGELIAATVAGMLPLGEALGVTREAARATEARCTEAAMVAVLDGPPVIEDSPQLSRLCEVACRNSASHCVVVLDPADVATLTAELDARGVLWAALPVRYGFHSARIDPVEPAYRELARGLRFAAPRIPILSCCLAGPLQRWDEDHLWRLTRQPVRFAETLARLPADGASLLIDAGPSGTLAAFAKQVLGGRAPVHAAMSQFGENLRTMQQVEAAVA